MSSHEFLREPDPRIFIDNFSDTHISRTHATYRHILHWQCAKFTVLSVFNFSGTAAEIIGMITVII